MYTISTLSTVLFQNIISELKINKKSIIHSLPKLLNIKCTVSNKKCHVDQWCEYFIHCNKRLRKDSLCWIALTHCICRMWGSQPLGSQDYSVWKICLNGLCCWSYIYISNKWKNDKKNRTNEISRRFNRLPITNVIYIHNRLINVFSKTDDNSRFLIP